MVGAHKLTDAMTEQVQRFARALSLAQRGEPTGVHQARVASRRIREILPIVETWEFVDEESAARPRRRRKDVRRVAAALGDVRELDVTLRVLAEAAARHEWQPDVVAAVSEGLSSDRTSRLVDLKDALEHVGARTFVRDLRRAAEGRPPKGVVLEVAMRMRRQARASELAATLRALGTLYVPDRLHAVRLAAKKLRYSLETQRAVKRAAVAREIRVLTGIQEELGYLHDLQVLQDRLRSVARQAHRAELRRMNADIERECRALHARIITRAQAWLKMADRLAEN